VARLIDFREGAVTIERHLFSIAGIEVGEPSPSVGGIIAAARVPVGPPASDSDEYPGSVYFASAGEDHDATVRIELWDGVPPAADRSDWEAINDLVGNSKTGSVRVWALTMGPADIEEIPLPIGRYNIRIHCRGREQLKSEIDRMFQNLDVDVAFPEGVEYYLIQLWPYTD
jgi:hypothetical protein